MTDPTQPGFYAPWPLFGKKFRTQLGEIREDTEVMDVISRATVFDKDPSTIKNSALQGWEVGERDFHNKYRTYWSKENTELQFQKNKGTEACPEWETHLSIDCETGRVTVNNQFRVLGGFYDIMSGLDRVFEWPRPKISDDFYNVFQLGASTADGFYFTPDEDGNPVLRLSDRIKGGGGGGLSTVRFQTTDPSPTFDSDTLTVNRGFFYLTPDSAGKPVLNLNERRIDVGQTGEPDVEFLEVKKVKFNRDDFYVTQNTDTDVAIVNSRGTTGGGGLSSIEVTESEDIDPTPTLFNTDKITFFGKDFYITPDSASKPVVNLRKPFSGDDIGSGAIIKEFTNAVEVKVTHNFLRKPLYWAIFDDADEAFIPEKVDVSDLNCAFFYMTEATSGTAMLMTGANAGSIQTSTTNNPVTQFISENVKFNRDHFYITPSSLGDPIINLTSLSAGGGGVADLQEAYEASTSPEIVVNSSNGAVTIRDNATPIGANLFEVEDNAGNDLFSVQLQSGTAAQFGVDADPSADVTRALGSEALRWLEIRARQGAFVHSDNFTTGGVIFADGYGTTEQGGLICGGLSETAGTARMRLGSTGYPASMIAGYVKTTAAGHTSELLNEARGGPMFGDAICAGAGTKVARIHTYPYIYGSFTGGRVYASGTSGATSRIYNYASGSFVWGNVTTSANITNLIQCTGNGSVVFGNVGSSVASTIQATQIGAFVHGSCTGTAAGSISAGMAGSFVQGATLNGGTISSTGGSQGAFVQGAASSSGTITASGAGSFSQGNAGSGTITATGNGAFAQGVVTAAGSIITASGDGSLAHGRAVSGYDITASANGAFAVGSAAGASIIASASNAFQFGQGTNALADSLQVGSAGLRLKGTTGAPGTPQNGDIWVASGYVYIRSNGVSVQIT